MARSGGNDITLQDLDEPTMRLVRASAALASGSEQVVRRTLQDALAVTPHVWMEELLLQTYLFAGFPRALNGMREWRRLAPVPVADVPPARAGAPAAGEMDAEQIVARGEATCARVYGTMYDRLRGNIRALHPLLDDWMISEGYGKVLGRPQLDLPRRELCIVAACAATGQDRQLQSHLHGARNVGVAPGVVSSALDSLAGLVPTDALERARGFWNRIAS